MFILHGVYHFRRKIVGYRSDFCLFCGAARLAYRVRSFEFLHVFFIPLLPLGFRRHWQCSVCNRSPHSRPGAERAQKWAATIFLGVVAIGSWFGDKEPVTGWIGVGLVSILFVVVLWRMIRSQRRLRPRGKFKLKEQLRQIQPASETTCLLCGSMLTVGERLRCSRCGAERAVLTV